MYYLYGSTIFTLSTYMGPIFDTFTIYMGCRSKMPAVDPRQAAMLVPPPLGYNAYQAKTRRVFISSESVLC